MPPEATPVTPANVYVVLDDVGPPHEAVYRAWQQDLAKRLGQMHWARECLRLRGVDALPGGIAKGEFYPRFLMLIVLDPVRSPSESSLAEIVGLPRSSTAQRMFACGFIELNVGRRRGRLLAEASPRTIFVICQKVYPGRETDYNHWFDVDDESREPPISHYDERLSYPGFLRGTRMTVRERSDDARAENLVPNYLTLYEVESPEALQSDAYTHAPQNRKSAGGGGMFRLLVRHTYVEIVD